MRIALLEDDQDQANLFLEWLKGAGHTCEHFKSGKLFVRNIRHDSYDMLILDWMVPEMDGFEVLAWVRENFDWPIPVLFLKAVARRASAVDEADTQIAMPPYLIDLANHAIYRDGVRVEVTQKEYELIVFLFRNVGRVLSRAHILESVWGRNPDVNTRTVDTHVSRIRGKLEITPESGWKLSSIYQHGYRLERPATP